MANNPRKFGLSIEMANDDVKRKKAQEQQNQDSTIRHEINKFIFKNYVLGESRENILKKLELVFSGPKYAKYRPFFEVWVDSRFENSKTGEKHEARSKNAKEAEGEER